MDSLSVMIEGLYYTTIERKIADYYDMGFPDNSNIPVQMSYPEFGSYYLICTKASGEFEIRITKQWMINNCYFKYLLVKDPRERSLTEGLLGYLLDVKYIEEEHKARRKSKQD